MTTDDLTTARAFGLAARVAELEDQIAKLRQPIVTGKQIGRAHV